jgi:hypothetical protein
LIYFFLAIGFPFRKKDVPITKPSAPPVHVKEQKHRKFRPRFTERFILRPLFSWLLGLKTGVDEISDQAAQIRAVARRFSTLWWPVVLPHLRLWLERTLHLCSIGIAIKAISGIYLRGLILEYEIIWRSTFIKDPLKIQKALEIIFSPVLFFFGPNLPSDVELLKAGGANAEGWIHLYAAYALLIIILPRSILALTSSKRLAKLSTVVQLSFDDEYYVDLFKKATMVSPKDLEAATKKIVAEECSQISENLSTFVCEKLYDDRITPKLWDFREHGGSLKSLEETLSNECLSFRSDLEFEIGNAEKILDDKIAHRISRLLGDDSGVACKPVEGLMGQVDEASSKAAVHVGEKVSRDLAAIVAGTVSTSVAIVAGTLSGGFGNSIGIALLTGLVHSGPIAWVIGAVGALIATKATLALGRDKLRKGVKSVPIPATALKVALWQNRYERLIADGRQKCGDSVKESLASKMDQLSTIISEHLWNRLKPIVGELQRPQVKVKSG